MNDRAVAAGAHRGARPSLPGPVRRRLFGLSLVLPAAVFGLALVAYPVARMLWMSVHNMRLTRPRTMNDYVGLEHYADLLRDPQFWHSASATLVYSFAVTALAFTIGLCTALLLNRRSRAVSFARMLLSLPWAVPGVVAGFTFVWMFDASFGVINYLIARLGFQPVQWLVRPEPAMIVIVLAAVWKTVPFTMLTQLAGLQAVPAELGEAARVDGANPWQEFRFITWPALNQVRTVAILLTVLHCFREFGQIYVITAGGPARATETLAVQLYIEAFSYFRFGYSAAIGAIMLAFSLIITVLTIKVINRRGFF